MQIIGARIWTTNLLFINHLLPVLSTKSKVGKTTDGKHESSSNFGKTLTLMKGKSLVCLCAAAAVVVFSSPPRPLSSLWLVDCKYWQAGVRVIITTTLTVGSSIVVLHSLRYHLSGMDLRRLTPLGLKGPPMGAGGGGGGGGAPIEAAQSSSHRVPGAAAHSFSCPPQMQQPSPASHSLERKTNVIKCDCDVLIKKY